MTWAGLRALWAERDNRYGYRKSHGRMLGLTAREVDAIRAYRRSEVTLLPSTERPQAVAVLNGWMPPVPVV